METTAKRFPGNGNNDKTSKKMTVIDDLVETINDTKCGYEKCKSRVCNDDDDDGAKKHAQHLKRCSRCKSRWYCSIDCQRADFPSHMKECRRKAAAAAKLAASDTTSSNKGLRNKMWTTHQHQQYQVEEREGKGRCLVATRTIHPKERITPPNNSAYSTPDNDYWDPIVPPVLNEDRRGVCCALCFREISLLLDADHQYHQHQHQHHRRSTPQTQNPLYQLKFCSQQCSNKARGLGLFEEETAISRFYQQAISSNTGVPPRIFSTAILVFRIALRLLQNDPVAREQIDELQSKPPKNFQDEDTENSVDEFHHTHAVIAIAINMLQFHSSCQTKDETTGRMTPPSIGFFTEILWKIKLNGFSICDGQSVTFGVGLFRTPASFINHACGSGSGGRSITKASRINAIQTFYFRQGMMPCLCLTAFADEAIQPGDEICISYIDTMRPSHLRQDELKRTYYFQCKCVACTEHLESEDGWRMGLVCKRCETIYFARGVPTVSIENTDIIDTTKHPSSSRCLNCNNTDFSKSLDLIKDFEDGQKKQHGEQRVNVTTTQSRSRSQLHRTYTNLKNVCSNTSWYVQESGEELLQSMLDEFSSCGEDDEEKRQRIGFEALALIEELVSSKSHESGQARQYVDGADNDRRKSSRRTSSSFLRHYQLMYKGAKLRLFLIPDPRRSIQELQDVMKALSPYYPQDHEFINGLKECLRDAMR